MIRPLFAFLVLLALLGDARVFLYILNRFVFGSHREERSPWNWLMFAVPPLLLALTLMFWPLSNWIDRLQSTRIVEWLAPERLEEMAWSIVFAKLGSAWLLIAAAVGLLWIVERLHALQLRDVPLIGVVSQPSGARRRWLHNDLYDIEVTRHEVFIDDLPAAFDGYRIAFLTDTHVAGFMRRSFYREVVAAARAFDPDLVLLGGDLVTWQRDIPLMGELLLTDLTAHDGVFAVLGNHDYWAGANLVSATLASHGIALLTNRAVTLHRDGDRLWLVGIDEMYRGTPDVAAAFAPIADHPPAVGVSHHPDIVDLLDGRRLDLLVCGHTHGGQIRFPFFGAVVVPSRHEGAYAAGFHRIRNVLLYVSRGIGAVPPLRILCRPEVATFTLRRGRRTE
ncbi:MAG TPA: metallophosphoesterase [Thermoanaerobaculia bacterium]|nr:metallophosphoesterase [Thermoanaerobaculia bacterium]